MKELFWENKGLKDLSHEQWESLCDGCGKCCLNKLQDDEEVVFTWVSCKYLDCSSCSCKDYDNRLKNVPTCLKITPQNIDSLIPILPKTCAYRLLALGEELFEWHHLISGDKNLVHELEISVKDMAVTEEEIDDEDLELFIVDEEDF